MPTDPNYGLIEVEKEPGTPFEEDEPVFLFRGRDANLVQLLDHYIYMCLEAGVGDEHIQGVRESQVQIREWQNQHSDLVRQPS